MRILKHITALLACCMFLVSGHAVQLRREPGHRIPEHILPTDPDNPVLWTGISTSLFTRAADPGAYAVKEIQRTGTIEYPLVLVDFSDLSFSSDDEDSIRHRYEIMFNKRGNSDTTVFTARGNTIYGVTGSVSDYFRDQSYGQYTPVFQIIGPIHLSRGYAYYGRSEYDETTRIAEMIREACDSILANGLADLAGYAQEGCIQQLSFIYAGKGENYVGSDPNTIWPHASIIDFSRTADARVYNSGIRSANYICVCELYWDTDIPDGIGTFCHEFSHTLGLPDFYNTSNNSGTDDIENAAMGYWSLMDYGNYENQGFSPVGYTAFEKYSLGWMDLEEVTYSGTYTLKDITRKASPSQDVHTAYRLNTGDDDQFIILENHLKTGWYRFHKSEGLMVTTVDYVKSRWDNNIINSYNSKHYRILPADNDYKRETNAGDLFPYQYSDSTGVYVIDSITTRGKPELKAGSSYPSFSIYNITRNGDVVSFRIAGDLPSSIKNPPQEGISIRMSGGELSVTAPKGSTVSIYDISGKPATRIVTSTLVQTIPLPGSGIWIVKCGNITRKVRL